MKYVAFTILQTLQTLLWQNNLIIFIVVAWLHISYAFKLEQHLKEAYLILKDVFTHLTQL